MPGKYVIVLGPSAVGKDTVVSHFLRTEPAMRKIVTTTTRPPRPGEVDGVHYHFTTAEDFEARIDAGDFLEYAETHGNYYGSSRRHLYKLLERHPVVFGVIDVKGARQIKRQMPECLVIMLTAPLEELRHRLVERFGGDDPQIAKRLSIAEWEMAQTDCSDHVIENPDDWFERTVAIVGRILHPFLSASLPPLNRKPPEGGLFICTVRRRSVPY